MRWEPWSPCHTCSTRKMRLEEGHRQQLRGDGPKSHMSCRYVLLVGSFSLLWGHPGTLPHLAASSLHTILKFMFHLKERYNPVKPLPCSSTLQLRSGRWNHLTMVDAGIQHIFRGVPIAVSIWLGGHRRTWEPVKPASRRSTSLQPCYSLCSWGRCPLNLLNFHGLTTMQ